MKTSCYELIKLVIQHIFIVMLKYKLAFFASLELYVHLIYFQSSCKCPLVN